MIADEATSTVAIVPAAGAGTRLGGRRKQYRTLGGAPVLVQTLRALAGCELVGGVVVAVPEDALAETEEAFGRFGLGSSCTAVAGGATRQASVARALAQVDSEGVVLVHDGVRPFLSQRLIADVIEAARQTGAAAAAVPVADTLRRGASGRFTETIERSGVYRMQTPQAFRAGLLRAAHAHAAEAGIVATDEVDLVQRSGHEVQIVVGDERNFKITTASDWALAEALWKEWMEATEVL